MSDFTDAQEIRTLQHFESGGQQIRVETFAGGGADAPSIIVLHGATGVEFANRFIAWLAQALSAQGFVTHLVHYFNRTGVEKADDTVINQSFAAWSGTINDAVSFIHGDRPEAKIGIFGYSLGGYLTAAESLRNPQIAAAVVLAGGVDEGSASRLSHAPPTLMLHGTEDVRVLMSEMRRLETALIGAGASPEVYLYEGEKHVMQAEAYADVVKRASEFFRRYLLG